MENHVRRIREKMGLTLRELAEQSGVPFGTIGYVERGGEPKVITAIRIARALECTVEELFFV